MAKEDYTPDCLCIPLTRGFSTVLDTEDSEFRELGISVITPKGRPYATTRLGLGYKAPKLYVHRLIMEKILGRQLLKGELVDHWDNDSLNNRRSNLRLTNKSGNASNAKLRSDGTTGKKGVTKVKTCNRWMAQITVNGKRLYLGIYDTPEQAYEVYCKAAKEHFGEFARLE